MESNVAQLPLGHKLWAWFEENKKAVIYGSAGVVLVGLVVWFFIWQKEEKEAAAGEALARVALDQSNPAAPHTDSAEAYLKVSAQYPNSAAGARALLLAAGNLFAEGKYPEAKTQFDKFVREYHSSPLLVQGLLGVAACLEAQGKASDAISIYKDLVEHHPNDPAAPQAKFALARLYEGDKKFEQARGLFEEVERADPYGSLGSEAGMRLEELYAKHPELAPKPTTVTNTLPLTPAKK